MTETKIISRLDARKIRIRLANLSPANSHPQIQSALFGKLPPEIRNLIFRYAIQASQIYSACRYCGAKSHDALQRGVESRRLVDFALLQTCRIVFHETAALPLRLTTLHGCIGSLNRLRHRIPRLTAMNVLDLNEVLLHGHGLSDVLRKLSVLSRLPQFQPSRLVLCIDVDMYFRLVSQARCGLSMQGTFPLSLQTLRLQLRAEITDPVEWKARIDSIYPLELILNDTKELLQITQALFETCGKESKPTNLQATIELSAASINSGLNDSAKAILGDLDRKTKPHFALSTGVQQFLGVAAKSSRLSR